MMHNILVKCLLILNFYKEYVKKIVDNSLNIKLLFMVAFPL